MVSRHLILKLYLWLLLALTLSVAGAAAAFVLLSPQSFEERAETFAREELGAVRDTMERLLGTGLPLESVRHVLAPLGEPHAGQMVLLGPDGRRLLQGDVPAGDAPLALSADDRARALREGVVMNWRDREHALVALPIRLPDGTEGVFAVSFRRFHWVQHGAPWRLLAGLGAVLVTLWLLSWPLAVHLARPLVRMAAVADALGQGDLGARIAPAHIQRRAWPGRRSRHAHPRRDEIGRLAQSFNTMADNLQRLVLGHKQLLADISHELRSPLARVRLALELARGAVGEERARYLDTLERQADAMDDLIGELLLHARLEEAPHALRPEPIAVEELLRSVLSAQQQEAEDRGVILSTRVAPGLPDPHAERRLLERALGNVLRNAIAYSPPGGTVEVSVTHEGGRIAFTVTDEGPGVPETQRERIFEPFMRTDTARNRATGGVGLGLAIVRRCMEAHGGGASAASGADGRGLAVSLWLPVGKET